MKNLRNRALEFAKATEQSKWERLISSRGNLNSLQKKQREWEVACYILKAAENYEKEVNELLIRRNRGGRMKLYEKMGIDPTTELGIKEILDMHCYNIGDAIAVRCDQQGGCVMTNMSCSLCKARRLVSEVPTKKIKRWEKYNGDFLKARKDFQEFCHSDTCARCKYNNIEENHFCIWLMEEIEVEENGN